MKRVNFSENFIKDTKRKFIIFSIVGIALVVLISLGTLRYHKRVVKQQMIVQTLHQTLSRQLFLIFEIAVLGENFEVNMSPDAERKLRSEFHSLVEQLGDENQIFSNLLKQGQTSSLEDLAQVVSNKDFRSEILEYLRRARELLEKKSNSALETKADIKFLSLNSREGLSTTIDFVDKKISELNTRSLKDLDNMGVLLILLCFFELGLIWLLVFKPLYSTITNQHEKLSDAVLQAESAKRSRNEFLANISHEIRTPMTGILGYAEILENSEDLSREKKAEYIRIINDNANHLLSLVDEILDVSRIESGKMNTEKEDVDLSKLLNEVYQLIKVKAQMNGLNIMIKNEGQVPFKVETDPKRFKQILFNIIGNAIKFTDQGLVEVKLSFERLRDKNVLSVFVTDTGCGISEKAKKKLFAPFEQADTSANRGYSGTGLGLVLARGLARGLGGDVTICDSVVGQGTTFKITIDAGDSAHMDLVDRFVVGSREIANAQNIKEKTLTDSCILVVDDANENARLFQLYLSNAGAHVDVANEGDLALTLLREREYDLILLDLQMPKKDGFQVLTEIRELKFRKPVIALTAHAMAEEKKKTREAGFDGHITKPVRSDVLIKSVSHFLT